MPQKLPDLHDISQAADSMALASAPAAGIYHPSGFDGQHKQGRAADGAFPVDGQVSSAVGTIKIGDRRKAPRNETGFRRRAYDPV